MTGTEPFGLALLLAWGTLVGLDLASGPQALLSRPLVAGAGAGMLLGDAAAGLTVGAVLELFALDVLPIGASRYPDFGVATIGGVVVAAGWPVADGLGAAVGVSLIVAMISRPLIEVVRRANARDAARAAGALAAGDPAMVSRLHRAGLARDALRSAGLTLLAVALALVVRAPGPLDHTLALPLALIATAGGLAAAVRGALRSASQGGRLAWTAGGMAVGLLILVLR